MGVVERAGDRQGAPLDRFQLGDRAVDVHLDADPGEQLAGEAALLVDQAMLPARGWRSRRRGRRSRSRSARRSGRGPGGRSAGRDGARPRPSLTSSGSPSTSTALPGSGSWKPERTLDQGRLAGAVLADQGVDLGPADLEADVLQGPLARGRSSRDARSGSAVAGRGIGAQRNSLLSRSFVGYAANQASAWLESSQPSGCRQSPGRRDREACPPTLLRRAVATGTPPQTSRVLPSSARFPQLPQHRCGLRLGPADHHLHGLEAEPLPDQPDGEDRRQPVRDHRPRRARRGDAAGGRGLRPLDRLDDRLRRRLRRAGR